MAQSFFWYDLETSGVDPRGARIMQFAGQRTDMELHPMEEPVNTLIRMTEDILPDPDAILLTGITPQMTLQDGVTEAEFLKLFTRTVATPDTIFVGYNSISFDDEFMRFLHYRNFYDPYEWQWQESRSRWDLLNVIRMTRALRPEGLRWPVDTEGKPTNRLELLTAQNGLDHANAHDALSDVHACIALARLVRNKQPKLFTYLLGLRDKKKVCQLVLANEPFVYTHSSFPSAFHKTAVVATVGEAEHGLFVYDLRYDPRQYAAMTPEQLAERWRYRKEALPEERLPVSVLHVNRCPAVAPISVLDDASKARLELDSAVIKRHAICLKELKDFATTLREAQGLLHKAQQVTAFRDEKSADAGLYDGFFDTSDRQLLSVVRAAEPNELGRLDVEFHDDRLTALLPLYVARNFPKYLNDEQRKIWDTFRKQQLLQGAAHSRLARYASRLQTLSERAHLTGEQRYILEELRLYAESVMPADEM